MFRRNSQPFQVPFRVKILYKLASMGWLRLSVFLVPFIILILGTLIFITSYSFLRSSITIFNDIAFIGLFGSLFGALIGAIIGGYTSLYIQSQQNRSVAAIKKKEYLYEPLYNALVLFKNDLSRFPYHHKFVFQVEDQRDIDVPYFIEWTNIKNDSRFVQTPHWIKITLEKHIDNITKYLVLRDEAANIVDGRIRELMNNEFKLYYSSTSGISIAMLRHILRGDYQAITNQLLPLFMQQSRGTDWQDKAPQLIVEECRKLSIVKQVDKIYLDTVVGGTNWLIQEIANIMAYISIRYESHENTI